MERLIAIVGPTATGKSDLALALAERLPIEIISGDSMMIYRHMDIGTAKPTLAERQLALHHMIDIVEPWQEFTVVDFLAQTRELISAINRRGNLPVIVGGTGLYFKALLEEYQFSPAPKDPVLREHLQTICGSRNAGFGHRWLQELSPLAAARLHPNDEQRIIRALEVYLLSGETVSTERQDPAIDNYDAVVIGLRMDRKLLYQRINKRVDLMFECGLLEEFQQLQTLGVTREHQAMKAIGYKEIVDAIAAGEPLKIARDKIKQHTRNYAKRQFTWFNRMPYIRWIDLDDPSGAQPIERCLHWITERWPELAEKTGGNE